MYEKILERTYNFSCKYPVENKEPENLYPLYDPTSPFKNIRNNRQNEIMQKLKFTATIANKEVTATCRSNRNI